MLREWVSEEREGMHILMKTTISNQNRISGVTCIILKA